MEIEKKVSIKNFTVNEKGKRLDIFLLSSLFDFSRSHIKKIIDDGNVKVNGKQISKAGTILKEGDVVEVDVQQPKEISTKAENIPLDIIYEDDDILVVNKPQGLVVHPCVSTKDGTLVNALLFHIKNLSGINGELRPGIVHRLDKDTSGLLVVAKNDFSHRNLAEQIKEKSARREYLAVLEGNLPDNCGKVETYLKRDNKDRKKISVQSEGRLAITKYEVVKRYEKCCLVHFSLQTGRTHQIRVHAKFLHHPIIGDKLYGHEEKGLNGQLLHAFRLTFVHPRTQKSMTFECQPPNYFQDYLKKQKEICEE